MACRWHMGRCSFGLGPSPRVEGPAGPLTISSGRLCAGLLGSRRRFPRRRGPARMATGTRWLRRLCRTCGSTGGDVMQGRSIGGLPLGRCPMLDTVPSPVHGGSTLSDAPVASMTAGCSSGGGFFRGAMTWPAKSRWRAMPWPFRRAALRLRLEEPDAVPDGPLASLVSLGCAAGLSVPEMCAVARVERHELLTLADGAWPASALAWDNRSVSRFQRGRG